MAKFKNKKILIDLDSLIDTRLGLLNLIDPHFVANMDIDKYINRIMDKFESPAMPPGKFAALYAKRDIDTLRAGVPTPILIKVAEVLREKLTGGMTPQPGSINEMDINIYPYRLSDDERAELASVTEFRMAAKLKVNIIRTPPSALPYSYVNDNYYAAILYGWQDWVIAQGENALSATCPDLRVIVPKLLVKELDPTQGTAEEKALMEKMGPFDIDALAFSSLFKLEFETVGLYSVSTGQ